MEAGAAQHTQHCLLGLVQRYPQLLIPVEEGASKGELYWQLVLRGGAAPENLTLDFALTSDDWHKLVDTPAGQAEVLFLSQRSDFEHVIQCLAYKCEPKAVPASMGAVALNGLIDWGKIQAHKEQWLAEGGSLEGWQQEFAAFTKDRSNIRGAIIVLSQGPYSAVPADVVGKPEDEWLADSLIIRMYHELTHFTSARLFPDNKEAIRDEVVADAMGLWAAYGCYDTQLARLFLGLDPEDPQGCVEGGRLRNYVAERESLEETAERASKLIETLSSFLADFDKRSICDKHDGHGDHDAATCFDVLLAVEEQGIGLP